MAIATDSYSETAEALRRACSRANSEMTVASRFETALVPLLAAHGVDYAPQREQRVVATRRRIDSQFGAVVTEYKERLVAEADWHEATAQLVGYIRELAPDAPARDQYVGVVTDGQRLRFVTFLDGVVRPEHPGDLDGLRLRRYVETLVALGRRGLTQEHLVEDFAAVNPSDPGLGRALARACYDALCHATAKTGMLQSEWQRIFAQSVDHQELPRAHVAAYCEALGLPEAPEDPARALFALQSAYAIVVKLVAARVLSELHLGVDVLRFDRLAASPDAELRRQMEQLEDGHLLRAYGFENLLEGDFFAWYASPDQWTPALGAAVRDVAQRLTDYEGRAPLLNPGSLGDLFQKLYQRTIPAAIRHDLGEYYTPRWLAQAVLADLPSPPDWRGLDPCCGSGTFVVEMIAEVLAETAHLAPDKRLAQVLRRVHGIDLNPLAVLTARVNYFLAIAALVVVGDVAVEIPVYLGDAAAVPRRVDLGGVPALAYTLPTGMGPLDVTLPLSLARKGARFGAVMRQVEAAVVNGDAAAGCRALAAGIGPEAASPAVGDAIAHFVDALVALEQQDWDRIWARIVKNFLATAAIGPFERVAGNPPWVEWKDLPDGYRETVNALCRERGLFSDDGYAGGTDLNICCLIAHTALERWVVPGGYLGFLMPRQLLQVRSAQGFRRWKLPDATPLAVRALADWTALRPFEAACQPVTYLIQRGVPGPEEVPVRVYTGGDRAGRAPGGAWAMVKPTLLCEEAAACQVDDDGGPYMIDAADILPRLLGLLGESAYRGRRATETSPHGVFWVRPVAGAPAPGPELVLVENALNPRAKDAIARTTAVVEKTLLHPLLRGAGIQPFRTTPDPALVIFSHEEGPHPIAPSAMPPLTLAYLTRYQDVLSARSSYKEYRSGGPFYGLWRVGPYTFAPYKVVWPEMGELRAAVVSEAPTPWGESKMLVPEGKVNLVGCEREDEAHYLCGVLNAPLIRRAYGRMSSQIGRPSRLPFGIPLFDERRWSHRALAAVSRAAHGDLAVAGRVGALLDRLTTRALTTLCPPSEGDRRR